MDKTKKGLPRSAQPVVIVHPLLFAVYPVLVLYASNLSVTSFSSIVRPAGLLILCALALWILLAVFLRKLHKAGILASLAIVLAVPGWNLLETLINAVQSYLDAIATPVYLGVFVILVAASVGAMLFWRRKNPKTALRAALLLAGGLLLVPLLAAAVVYVQMAGQGPAWLIAAYLVAGGACMYAAARYRGDFSNLTIIANWFSFLLIVLYGAYIAYNGPGAHRVEFPELPDIATPQTAQACPDIYLFLLDGYPRSDVLRERLGYNNLLFEIEMRNLGFTMAKRSMANYSSAGLAAAACLNLGYIPKELTEEAAADPVGTVARLYCGNRMFSLLKSFGYKIFSFSPGVECREHRAPIDTYLDPPNTLSEFETVLLGQTIAARLLRGYHAIRHSNPAYWRLAPWRARTLYAFAEVQRLASQPSESPRFFCIRLPIPGTPFLFARDGGVPEPYVLNIADGQLLPAPPPMFQRGYADQLYFTNEKLIEMASTILNTSARPSVILITSPQGYVDPDQDAPKGIRYANLAMARFPQETSGNKDAELYESISLVNLFRVVLNRVFDAGLELLPDTVYESKSADLLEFAPLDPAELEF